MVDERGEEIAERPTAKDTDTPSFRQLALNVYNDSTLADPFLDGAAEDSPDEDRKALKAMLTKHFGYSPEELMEIDSDAYQFTGKNGQPITIRTGTDEDEPYLEFTTGIGEPKKLISESLKLGAPIAIALAHLEPDQLSRIYDKRTKNPHVRALCTIEVNQESEGPHGTRTKSFTLRNNNFQETDAYFGQRMA